MNNKVKVVCHDCGGGPSEGVLQCVVCDGEGEWESTLVPGSTADLLMRVGEVALKTTRP